MIKKTQKRKINEQTNKRTNERNRIQKVREDLK
jgi:hypothetical protein